METRPYLLHALSPVHAGVGQSVETIDLPIARMRATGIPIVPGSSLKGVLRSLFAEFLDPESLFTVFGPDTPRADENAGALGVGDARLLCLPVRSFLGTFAWVTSPLLLALAARDMASAASCPVALPVVDVPGRHATVANAHASSVCFAAGAAARVYLEDLDLPVSEEPVAGEWAKFLAPLVAPLAVDAFRNRFLVVDDDTMGFLWETCTQIDTRIRLDDDSGTVADGQLWLEESLPPESVMVGLLTADRGRRASKAAQYQTPSQVLNAVLSEEKVIQVGGKATVGRGLCRFLPIAPCGAAAGQGG